jgi:hypothetical protein
MQPSVGAGPFDDPDYLFEPWWPGVRALAWIDDGRLVRLQAEGMADALTAFAELGEELPERLTVDGSCSTAGSWHSTMAGGWTPICCAGDWPASTEPGAGLRRQRPAVERWGTMARPAIRDPSRSPRQRASRRGPLRRLSRAPG